MNPEDLKFTRQELDEARLTAAEDTLLALSEHQSRFVRAVVAGNPNTPLYIRQALARDKSPGVLLWLVGNPSITKDEFDVVWRRARGSDMWNSLKSTLAGNRQADIRQLTDAARENDWAVTLSIINNHRDRGDEYKKLITPYVPSEDKPFKMWSEIEKLAYFRMSGRRIPNNQD
jgi:hypothetical protein